LLADSGFDTRMSSQCRSRSRSRYLLLPPLPASLLLWTLPPRLQTSRAILIISTSDRRLMPAIVGATTHADCGQAVCSRASCWLVNACQLIIHRLCHRHMRHHARESLTASPDQGPRHSCSELTGLMMTLHGSSDTSYTAATCVVMHLVSAAGCCTCTNQVRVGDLHSIMASLLLHCFHKLSHHQWCHRQVKLLLGWSNHGHE
jgi:hypothetical protein